MKNPRDERRWTTLELEADPGGYRAAQQARLEDEAVARARAAEEDDRRHFTETFAAAGGTRSGAEAAYRVRRDERAAEAARTAAEVARRVQHGAAMGAL